MIFARFGLPSVLWLISGFCNKSIPYSVGNFALYEFSRKIYGQGCRFARRL